MINLIKPGEGIIISLRLQLSPYFLDQMQYLKKCIIMNLEIKTRPLESIVRNFKKRHVAIGNHADISGFLCSLLKIVVFYD